MTSFDILRGKTAVITGSGRGIGRAIALELAGYGGIWPLTTSATRPRPSRRPPKSSSSAARRLWLRRMWARSRKCSGWSHAAAEAFGGVDIFVGNAASGVIKSALRQELKGWDWTLNVNARSILFGAQAAAQHMMRGGWGRIIGIGSIGARRVLP